MKKNRWYLRLLALLVLCGALNVTITAAAEAGSSDDPLVLTGDIGCEVMLRVGTAVCVSPSSPGLIDETAATALNNGSALVQNHLYMMTIEGRGVRATAGTTKLLVRGSYTVA